jgi:DNA-binding XRE family transcriptional regulator
MDATQYKETRERLGLTQAGLAALLGVTRATINAREAGRTPITEEASRALRTLKPATK